MPKRLNLPKGPQIQKQPSTALIPAEDYFLNLPPEEFPATYQATLSFFEEKFGNLDAKDLGKVALSLRQETIKRIEAATKRSLICYTSKIYNPPQPQHTSINHFDLVGFSDLISTISPPNVDILIVSNGGEVEATDRIVTLLRERFNHIRYIVPSNAFSAATLLCFSGDEILMGSQGTLGPIDPQMNGTPIQAILEAFKKAKTEIELGGMNTLLAYWPLLSKYSLPVLEVGKQYKNLSESLAKKWLSSHMLHCEESDQRVIDCVEFFSAYETHMSHGRSIAREEAKSKKLEVRKLEQYDIHDLVLSLFFQYVFMFDKSQLVKFFENAHGIHWGWGVAPPTAPTEAGKK